MLARNRYMQTLSRFSDGEKHTFNDSDSSVDHHSVAILLDSNLLNGSMQKTSSFCQFADIQITPSGMQMLLEWTRQIESMGFRARITPAVTFLIGAIVSPILNDIYAGWVKPHILPKIPEQEIIERNADRENQNVGHK